MKKLEVKLSDEDMDRLDDLVRIRQSRLINRVVSRAEVIRLLIEAEWLAQLDKKKELP